MAPNYDLKDHVIAITVRLVHLSTFPLSNSSSREAAVGSGMLQRSYS